MKLDFLIMYEIRVRELESIFLLGEELKERGYNVDYISFDEVSHNSYLKNRKKLKKYFGNVKVVLVPSLYHDNEIYNTVYYVCGQCEKIVNLRWEQYFTNKEMENLKSYLFPREDAKKAYHICWGKQSYESLIIRGIDESKLIQTGALQLDFLRPEFSNYYMTSEKLFSQYNIPSSAKTLLYISSFADATRTERLEETVKKDFNGLYKFDEDEYLFHLQSYEITLDWIEEFLINNQDIYFIYRPHPSENITEKIEKLLKKYKNFKIISDYSVKQWILTCDVITTWVSTSIVEAYYAGKACFIVRPLPYSEQNDMSIYKDAKFITSKEKFVNSFKTKKEMSVSNNVMCNYYDVKEKEPSYIRLSNELEKLISNNDRFVWNKEKMQKFDKKRKMLFIRNIIFIGYYTILRIFSIVSQKTGIKFGNYLDSRISNYRLSKKMDKYNKYNNNSFEKVQEQINYFYKQLK